MAGEWSPVNHKRNVINTLQKTENPLSCIKHAEAFAVSLKRILLSRQKDLHYVLMKTLGSFVLLTVTVHT